MALSWRPTKATDQTRYDDIWIISPQVGWAVNSAGEIVHTEDGERLDDPADGRRRDVASLHEFFQSQRRLGRFDHAPRAPVANTGRQDMEQYQRQPATAPSAICGICSPSKNVVFASGTQYPNREAGIVHTSDGGQTWKSISMAAHANLLIDNYFSDDLTGWVVGGHGGTTYSRLKPVVLHTTDGGKSWENVLQNSGIDFPTGEWGWKIQFLTPQIGFVSLENDAAGAMLKTRTAARPGSASRSTIRRRTSSLKASDSSPSRSAGSAAGATVLRRDKPKAPPAVRLTAARHGSTPTMSAASSTVSDSRAPNPIVGYASGGTIYQMHRGGR